MRFVPASTKVPAPSLVTLELASDEVEVKVWKLLLMVRTVPMFHCVVAGGDNWGRRRGLSRVRLAVAVERLMPLNLRERAWPSSAKVMLWAGLVSWMLCQ